VNSCRLQFDVELAAVHVGMVQSSTDAELAVILVEDFAGPPGKIPWEPRENHGKSDGTYGIRKN
jgi:hypothetical protein